MKPLKIEELPKPPEGKKGWPWTEGGAEFSETAFDKKVWPKISIVTPSFNQGNFLEETIRSVLLQGYPNLEYIVMDGGSTDNTADIIKKYERFLACVVSAPDDGQADAIQKGFEKSSGDILAWCNSDDVYCRSTFVGIAECFEKNECDFVYGDEYLIDERSQIIGEKLQLPFPGKLGLPFFVYGGFLVYQPASFWKRRLYEQCGGIDAKYTFAMDPDLFIRFAANYADFKRIKRYVINFRFHERSKTCTLQETRIKERQDLILKYKHMVPAFFRNRAIMRILGMFYFFSHIFIGNGKYLIRELARRAGMVKDHRLNPY